MLPRKDENYSHEETRPLLLADEDYSHQIGVLINHDEKNNLEEKSIDITYHLSELPKDLIKKIADTASPKSKSNLANTNQENQTIVRHSAFFTKPKITFDEIAKIINSHEVKELHKRIEDIKKEIKLEEIANRKHQRNWEFYHDSDVGFQIQIFAAITALMLVGGIVPTSIKAIRSTLENDKETAAMFYTLDAFLLLISISLYAGLVKINRGRTDPVPELKTQLANNMQSLRDLLASDDLLTNRKLSSEQIAQVIEIINSQPIDENKQSLRCNIL